MGFEACVLAVTALGTSYLLACISMELLHHQQHEFRPLNFRYGVGYFICSGWKQFLRSCFK
jgi:hypothetical protein